MGLFGFGKPKETLPYEVPPLLTTKEIRKIEAAIFVGSPLSDEKQWLLNFAAPMQARERQSVFAFPKFEGSRLEKMEKAFKENFGEPTYGSIWNEMNRLLEGRCSEFIDPVYQMTQEYPCEEWAEQTRKKGCYSPRQIEKLKELHSFYRRMEQYGLPLPSKTVYAYDLCRAANMILISVGIGVMRSPEAFDCLRYVAAAANRYYSSWEEYCGAYVTGRALWMWNIEQLLLIALNLDFNACRILLCSPQSPCGEISFSYGLESCELCRDIYVPQGGEQSGNEAGRSDTESPDAEQQASD